PAAPPPPQTAPRPPQRHRTIRPAQIELTTFCDRRINDVDNPSRTPYTVIDDSGNSEVPPMTKVIVNIPSARDNRKKNWAKVLESVDTTKPNGYAFLGNWLRRGERAELTVGSYVLTYDEPG